MAFDSRLHAAYLEEGPDPNEVTAEDLRELDEAEPHPIMDFFRGLWRRTIFLFKLSLFLALVGAYPFSAVMSHKIDDSDIVFADGQKWAFPESGIAITKIARELEGKGWADDKPNWHPQACPPGRKPRPMAFPNLPAWPLLPCRTRMVSRMRTSSPLRAC